MYVQIRVTWQSTVPHLRSHRPKPKLSQMHITFTNFPPHDDADSSNHIQITPDISSTSPTSTYRTSHHNPISSRPTTKTFHVPPFTLSNPSFPRFPKQAFPLPRLIPLDTGSCPYRPDSAHHDLQPHVSLARSLRAASARWERRNRVGPTNTVGNGQIRVGV